VSSYRTSAAALITYKPCSYDNAATFCRLRLLMKIATTQLDETPAEVVIGYILKMNE
jgi:hypothetical protein